MTTCHNYQIHYKYQWKCSQPSCTWTFGRHSKSLSVEKHRCGRCSSKIIFIGNFDSNGKLIEPKKVSKYQQFVKEMSSKVRKEHPEYDFAKTQQHIAKLWKRHKERHQEVSFEATASTTCMNGVSRADFL